MRAATLDHQKVEAIRLLRFPGSKPDRIAAAANAITSLEDD